MGGISAWGGPILGRGLASATPWIAGGSRIVIGGAVAYGAYQGGGDIGEGIANGNASQVLLGVGETGLSFAGAGALAKPRLSAPRLPELTPSELDARIDAVTLPIGPTEPIVIAESPSGNGVAAAPAKPISVRKRDYPTRVRKTTLERLEAAATDESGQIVCQSPNCAVSGGRTLEPGEGSPQHNPPLVETHNQSGWNVDQPTRNDLYNDTATELHCIECQRAEGGAIRSTYRQETGPNYKPRLKRKSDVSK